MGRRVPALTFLRRVDTGFWRGAIRDHKSVTTESPGLPSEFNWSSEER